MTTIPLPANTVLVVSDDRPVSLAERFGILCGQAFTFEYPDGRVVTWSIDMAKEIIGNREPQTELSLYQACIALQRNSLSDEINLPYAMTTDLSKPIIAVVSPLEEQPEHVVLVIVDGWHRIARMVLEQREEPLRVHVLSRDEEMQCRVERIQR